MVKTKIVLEGKMESSKINRELKTTDYFKKIKKIIKHVKIINSRNSRPR